MIYYAIVGFDFHTHGEWGGECKSRIEENKPINISVLSNVIKNNETHMVASNDHIYAVGIEKRKRKNMRKKFWNVHPN